MLQANFNVSPLTGTALATKFTITNLTTGASINQYVWDFGLEEFIYDEVSPTITYDYPGTYIISLSAKDFDGNVSAFSQIVTVDLAHRDYIRFTHIPERFADPGRLTTTPFKFQVVSSNPKSPIIVDLFAANSPSVPLQFATKKWNFLTPVWKFLDKDLNPITSLSLNPEPIYQNSTIVAVSAMGEFYYVDSSSVGDLATNCPLLLTVTLQTSGFNYSQDSKIYPYSSYANNQTVRAGIVWHVNDLKPTLLKITGNYLENIERTQWKDIKIPFLITAHGNRSHILPGSEDSTSEILFTYPDTNNSQYPVTLTLTNLLTSNFIVDEGPLHFKAVDYNNMDSKGYIFTTITPLTSIDSTSIVAQTRTTPTHNSSSNIFPYPAGYAPNISVWVSNPQKNTINRVTLVPDTGNCKTINYFRDLGILADGNVLEVTVPSSSSTNTFNYEMSGFSGIYGVAIDPRNYDLIAADAELDRLYRISNNGEILKTFELSSLNDYNPNKKMFEFWSWKTQTPAVQSTTFTFYKPAFISSNFNNYILQAGGVVLPSSYIDIDNNLETLNVLISSLNGEYFAENIDIDVIQIFNPLLPNHYINSTTHWTSACQVSATSLLLTNTPSLSTDPNYYIVTVNGVVQRPDTYTINNTNKTVNFSTPLPLSTIVNVIYLPAINTPTNWIRTINTHTTIFNLTGSNNQQNYIPDPYSSFLVSIGGILQNPEVYTFDVNNQRLVFNTPLPQNVPISVTQITVPENVNATAAYTPAYISLDKNYNIWVSLFNTVSVLKFDPDFNLLFSAAPTGINWPLSPQFTSPQGVDYLAEFEHEFLLKPPAAETDKENNCWVTYANPLCSLLVKFNETGTPILQIPLEKYSIPINITINAQNNVWVSNSYGSSYNAPPLSGNIQLYSTNTGELLHTIADISRPGHIALDRNNNVWFSHGLRQIGYYNTATNSLSTWIVNRNGTFSQYTVTSDGYTSSVQQYYNEAENYEDEELGGLAVDVYNRVWVIDSITNNTYVLSAIPNFTDTFIRTFKIKPDTILGYYIDLYTGSTYTESGDFDRRSAQATGDWTGNRWYQKYANLYTQQSLPISGVSNNFSIIPFTNQHQIRRINETFNTAEYYRSLALPDALNTNTVLLDKFFPATVGTGYLSANEDIGQKVYERIANFVYNHSDIDTCNIDQLLSLADLVAVPARDYAATYPAEIKDMLDVASISRSHLWGIKDNVPVLTQSLGEQYNTQTDTLTAGTSVILKSKFDSSLSLLQVLPLPNGETVYGISQFYGYGLVEPITNNYIFYRFKPGYTGKSIENIIDWDSPYTTQTRTASTLEQWYGDDGALETAFRYLLTKNLFPK